MDNDERKIGSEEVIEKVDVDISKFQVVRKEFFVHSYDYSISIRPDKIRFSASIVKRLADVFYVHILMNQEDGKMMVVPCGPDDKNAIQWGYLRAKNNRKASRDIGGKLFSMKLYKTFGWATNYRYKITGALVQYEGKFVLLFNMKDIEAFPLGERGKSYLPEEWMNSFGLPVKEFEESLKVTYLNNYSRVEIIKKRNKKIEPPLIDATTESDTGLIPSDSVHNEENV